MTDETVEAVKMQEIAEKVFAKTDEAKGEDPIPVWTTGQDVTIKSTGQAAKVNQVFQNGTVEVTITTHVTVSAKDLR